MKKAKKTLAVLFAAIIVFMTINVPLMPKADEHANQVHVIIKNETYSTAEGAAWEGTIDTWIDVNSGSSAYYYMEKAVTDMNQTIAEDGNGIVYLCGLTVADSWTRYWCFFINDTMAPVGLKDYIPVAGDIISMEWTNDGGADVNADWQETSNELSTMIVNTGTLEPAFSPDVTEYALKLESDVEGIAFSLKAANRNSAVSIVADGVTYRASDTIPIGDNISIKLTRYGADDKTYTVSMEEAKTESEGEDIEKAPATKDEIMAMGADLTGIVSKSLTAEACVYGNEWTVMTAARAGVLTDEMKNVYYESLVKALSDNSGLDGKAVTYAKVILTLSAIGKNPENVNGVNLLKPLSDLDFVVKAGVNSTMYVLLALDSKDYNIPTAEAGKTQTTREALVAEILSHEISGGGWDWSDAAADTDMTAIGIQSLTPYYNINAEAKAAVDRGLAVLSDMQNADGSFSSYGSKNACSAAQVITALMGMGINPLTDDRFIKGGYTAFDGINAFYVSGQGVKGYGNVIDFPFSTIQSAYAFVAYDRVLNGKSALYDMTDVSAVEDKKAEEIEKNDKSPNTGDEDPIDFVVMLIMVSGLGIITQKRRIRV